MTLNGLQMGPVLCSDGSHTIANSDEHTQMESQVNFLRSSIEMKGSINGANSQLHEKVSALQQ